MHRASHTHRAFTLIELTVVIIIIAILIGLLFPALHGIQDQAKRTQAKNDLSQIVTAVNAFYTEYGRYPLPSTATTDTIYGPEGTSNADLFYTLRAVASGANLGNAINTRQIVFISPPVVKDTANPRAGVGTDGQWYDPWGTAYSVAIDGNYNNIVKAPAYTDLTTTYATATDGSGDVGVRTGVIAWSYGSDQTKGTKSPPSTNYNGSDDVISWQ